MKFTKRTTAPSSSTEFYGNKNPFVNTYYDMFRKHPLLKGNCTHYCYSRMSEVIGKKSNLPSSSAHLWIRDVKGYETGSVPKIGSVIVWKHTKKSGGHVAFIEEIKSNGDLVVSMSGWNSFLFKTKTITKASGYVYSDYAVVGFIYPPVTFSSKTNYSGSYPTLPIRGYFQKGDKGANVKLLQKLLNWLNGCNLSVDGIIGNKTVQQIKNFQASVGITIDGKFGRQSLAKAKEAQR